MAYVQPATMTSNLGHGNNVSNANALNQAVYNGNLGHSHNNRQNGKMNDNLNNSNAMNGNNNRNNNGNSNKPDGKATYQLPIGVNSESELNDFFMFRYRVHPCQQRRNCPHKATCAGWHHEQERRRNPTSDDGDYRYSEEPCPAVRNTANNSKQKWNPPSICTNGDNCSFTHTLMEQMYHPNIYKTSMCHNFQSPSGNHCQWGYYCTHAHGSGDIRNPNKKFQNQQQTNAAAVAAASAAATAAAVAAHNANNTIKNRADRAKSFSSGAMVGTAPNGAASGVPNDPSGLSRWRAAVGNRMNLSVSGLMANTRAVLANVTHSGRNQSQTQNDGQAQSHTHQIAQMQAHAAQVQSRHRHSYLVPPDTVAPAPPASQTQSQTLTPPRGVGAPYNVGGHTPTNYGQNPMYSNGDMYYAPGNYGRMGGKPTQSSNAYTTLVTSDSYHPYQARTRLQSRSDPPPYFGGQRTFYTPLSTSGTGANTSILEGPEAPIAPNGIPNGVANGVHASRAANARGLHSHSIGRSTDNAGRGVGAGMSGNPRAPHHGMGLSGRGGSSHDEATIPSPIPTNGVGHAGDDDEMLPPAAGGSVNDVNSGRNSGTGLSGHTTGTTSGAHTPHSHAQSHNVLGNGNMNTGHNSISNNSNSHSGRNSQSQLIHSQSRMQPGQSSLSRINAQNFNAKTTHLNVNGQGYGANTRPLTPPPTHNQNGTNGQQAPPVRKRASSHNPRTDAHPVIMGRTPLSHSRAPPHMMLPELNSKQGYTQLTTYYEPQQLRAPGAAAAAPGQSQTKSRNYSHSMSLGHPSHQPTPQFGDSMWRPNRAQHQLMANLHSTEMPSAVSSQSNWAPFDETPVPSVGTTRRGLEYYLHGDMSGLASSPLDRPKSLPGTPPHAPQAPHHVPHAPHEGSNSKQNASHNGSVNGSSSNGSSRRRKKVDENGKQLNPTAAEFVCNDGSEDNIANKISALEAQLKELKLEQQQQQQPTQSESSNALASRSPGSSNGSTVSNGAEHKDEESLNQSLNTQELAKRSQRLSAILTCPRCAKEKQDRKYCFNPCGDVVCGPCWRMSKAHGVCPVCDSAAESTTCLKV